MTSLKVLEQRVEQYQSCADIERGAKVKKDYIDYITSDILYAYTH